jgi:hypothetical protein
MVNLNQVSKIIKDHLKREDSEQLLKTAKPSVKWTFLKINFPSRVPNSTFRCPCSLKITTPQVIAAFRP